MTLYSDTMKSPVGKLTLVADDHSLRAVLWEDDEPKRTRLRFNRTKAHNPVLARTKAQLKEYFDGKRRSFDLPIRFEGTDFQEKVWKSLMDIPFGETRSYGELAKELGNPKASRAVGAANGRNPISIIVPCHRVIGATGKLTGFAGGLDVKEKLLALESSGG